jgi:hypothetical protein
MDEEMSVRSASFVVTWEYRLKGDYAVGVSGLDTAQVCRVPAVVCDVAGYVDAAVDTGCVAVPDVDVKGRDPETGGYVQVLYLEVQRDAGLPFGYVLSD